jgi:hypothetical protein
MALRATRDTYGYEDMGGVEVRRQVFAGQLIPEHYRLERDAVVTDEREGPPAYPLEYAKPKRKGG